MTNDKITVSRELLRQALQAHRAMREWIKAAPEPLVSMPGADGDWLNSVEGMLRNALKQQITQTGVGNSGFDYKTAADFLSGNEINDKSVRRFVASSRWAHDDRASLQALVTTLHHDIATRDADCSAEADGT